MKRRKLTECELHRILAEQFGIEPVEIEPGVWGYKREQFEEAFRVFLPPAEGRRVRQ